MSLDLWELNPGDPVTIRLSDQETNLAITEGKQLFTMATASVDEDMCIRDITLTVTITHACAQNLQIRLYGPGPSNFPYRLQNTESTYGVAQEQTWDDQNSFDGATRTTPSTPSGRSFPATVFEYNAHHKPACLSGQRTMVFTDKAENTLMGYDGDIQGTFRPVEPLAIFKNLPAAGEWTLMLYDREVDGNVGVLESWDVEFTMEKCTPTYSWTNIGSSVTGTGPSKRFEHTAIVVDNSMFVYGGRADEYLYDMFRLDYVAGGVGSKWITLAPAPYTRNRIGRSSVLTPFQMLDFGGLVPTSRASTTSRIDPRIWRRDVTEVHEQWSLVNTTGSLDVPKPLLHREQGLSGGRITGQQHLTHEIPLGRYQAAAVFLSDYDTGLTNRGVSKCSVLVFGGYDSTTLFDDTWELNLKELGERYSKAAVAQERSDYCEWQTTGTYGVDQWQNSCAGNMPNQDCSVHSILLHAWCGENYQSIHNI